MSSWLVETAVVTAVLSAAVWLACRVFRPRPAIAHALWLVVLVKLVTPTVIRVGAWDPGEVTTASPLPTFPPVPLPSGSGAPVDTPFVRELPASDPLDVGALLFALWLCGILVVGASQAFGVARTAIAARRREGARPSLAAAVAAGAARLGVGSPRLATVPGLPGPCVAALPDAWLLVPERAEPGRAVLAHELAHLGRRDHWVAWLEMFAMCLWWWNPVFWFARARLRNAADRACDALAVSAEPGSRVDYATALVDAAERRCRPGLHLANVGIRRRGRRAFARRLLLILDGDVRTPRRAAVWACGLLLLTPSLGEARPSVIELPHIEALRIELEGDVEVVASTDGSSRIRCAPGVGLELTGSRALVYGTGRVTVELDRPIALDAELGRGTISVRTPCLESAELRTRRGDIVVDVAAVRGALSAATRVGNVSAKLREAQHVRLRAGFGNVRVELPKSAPARCSVDVPHGTAWLALAFGATQPPKNTRNPVVFQRGSGGPSVDVTVRHGNVLP